MLAEHQTTPSNLCVLVSSESTSSALYKRPRQINEGERRVLIEERKRSTDEYTSTQEYSFIIRHQILHSGGGQPLS